MTVTVTRAREHVALVELDRPEQLNAMTGEMFDDIAAVARDLAADREVRAVVLTGAGRGFSAGFDRREARALPSLGPAEMLRLQERAAGCVRAVHDIPQPVIAAINGPAAGGGFSLALAADVRFAAEDALLIPMFVKGGYSAGDLGCSWFLPRLVGLGRAAEMMLSGRAVPADEAERIGLVSRVVPSERLRDEALDFAEQLSALSPIAVRMTLRSLYANVDAPSLRTAVELENRGQALLSPGPDVAEVFAAAEDGRPPTFDS